MADLDNWPILKLFGRDRHKLRTACVFGNSASEVLVVTCDGDVYALGTNLNGCLGVGKEGQVLLPQKVDALCKRGIKAFACGSGLHVLAISDTGKLYSWGSNGFGQLGNGAKTNGLTPSLLLSLSEKKVVEIACGNFHSLALTDAGEVYAWGQNDCGQLGTGSTFDQAQPQKIGGNVGSQRCVSIACGQSFSIVLLANGQVYGWGFNASGELGVGSNSNQLNPVKVCIPENVFIQKVVCGYSHSMALSDEGVLYAWGANYHGQLGTGDTRNSNRPVRISSGWGRIVEMAASHLCHISAALNEASKVYVWGNCRKQAICAPTLTSLHSLHDVFAFFAQPAITWEPLISDVGSSVKVTDTLKRAFDDKDSSDVKFHVDGKFIHAHRTVLKLRSEYFRTMFQEHWSECKKDVIEIKDVTYEVYRAFLKYLYTDEVDLLPEDAIYLYELAHLYGDDHLCELCNRIIRYGITAQNAAILYSASMKYSEEDLKEYCFRFAMNHMSGVVQSQAFTELEDQVSKDFVSRAAREGAFKS